MADDLREKPCWFCDYETTRDWMVMWFVCAMTYDVIMSLLCKKHRSGMAYIQSVGKKAVARDWKD